jgi:hypothetical protein
VLIRIAVIADLAKPQSFALLLSSDRMGFLSHLTFFRSWWESYQVVITGLLRWGWDEENWQGPANAKMPGTLANLGHSL